MPGSRCVVQGCSNSSKISSGIFLHCSPVDKSTRDAWVRFVRTHRANFKTEGRFMICSEHFEPNSFERTVHIEGCRRFLLPRSIPTVWTTKNIKSKPTSARSRRKVSTSNCVISCKMYITYVIIITHDGCICL